MRVCACMYVPTYLPIYLPAYLPTYLPTYVRMYVRTYVGTRLGMCRAAEPPSRRAAEPPSRRAAEFNFGMIFGRTDLRIGQSEAKVDAESDFDIRLPAGAPNPVPKLKTHTKKIEKMCLMQKKVSWSQMKALRLKI